MKVKVESEYLKSETESPVKSYPLSGFLTLVKTGAPCLSEPRKGLAGREARAKAARTPLRAALEGMLRTPGGSGGRPPPATSAGCHGNGGNVPVPATGSGPRQAPACESKIRSLSWGSKMDERRPPGRGVGRFGNPGNPFFPGHRIVSRSELDGAGAGDPPSAGPGGVWGP